MAIGASKHCPLSCVLHPFTWMPLRALAVGQTFPVTGVSFFHNREMCSAAPCMVIPRLITFSAILPQQGPQPLAQLQKIWIDEAQFV